MAIIHPVAPDHATFARFRSIHFAPCAKRILAEMSNTLFDVGEISGRTIFIDGTKIEACANKYTFVWKKEVTKNQAKLLVKIMDLIAECEQNYDIYYLAVCRTTTDGYNNADSVSEGCRSVSEI